MATEEHHMPDVDRPKHSLLSMHKPAHHTALARNEEAQESTIQPAAQGASGQRLMVRSKKRTHRKDNLIAALCHWTVEHQVGLSANLLLLHALAHICFPVARDFTRKFYRLSYYNPVTEKYAAGWDDFYMVLYSIVVLTGLRAATLDYILIPLVQVLGVTQRKERIRFAEQAWILIYYSLFCPMGTYIMYNSPYWMNFQELWTGFPNRELDRTMKWYYLVQFSFWLQQIVVVNIEERRKDHWQMFMHHVITCVLMFTSYGYHLTKVGNLILCLMDVVDMFLALAKILKYLKYQLSCDIAFGVFMLAWFVARHVIYMGIIVSIFQHIPSTIHYECYRGGAGNMTGPFPVQDDIHSLIDPFRNPSGLVCMSKYIKWGFVTTLLMLQMILVVWFGMIIRVAIKVISGSGADDSRSEDEEDEEDEEEYEELVVTEEQPRSAKTPSRYIAKEVGVEDINLRSSKGRRARKSGGVASGVSLPSDSKELLGRIGCDGGHT